MTPTNNPGAIDAQQQGAKLYHLEYRPKNSNIAAIEHYYFPTLEALKNYMEAFSYDDNFYTFVYIMQIGENGDFVDVWGCDNVELI